MSADSEKDPEEAFIDEGDDIDDDDVDVTGDVDESGKMRPHVDKDGLPLVPGLSADEIRDSMKLFFVNKQQDALEFFAKYDEHPMLATLKGATTFVKAVMSLEEADIAEAMDALNSASLKARQAIHRHRKGVKQGLIDADNAAFESEFVHYKLMTAECKLLTAGLQFLREGVVEKAKGGLNIRGAWQVYSKVAKQHSINGGEADHLDKETRSAVQFGIGVFNLLCSTLPPKLLKIVSVLGFPSDRDVALQNLRHCFFSECALSPVAGLALLAHHVVLQASFSCGDNKYAGEAEIIFEECFKRYPEGGLFLMMHARYLRSQRKVPEAIETFSRAMEAQKDWRQLAHICHYEIAWSRVFQFDWASALPHYELLLSENDWSKAFFMYMKAICKFESGDIVEALPLFSQVSELAQRKINGRPIAIDSFIFRKVKTYCKPDRCELILPDLEIIYLHNGFTQMDTSHLKDVVQRLDSWTQGHPTARPDAASLVNLLTGAAHAQLGNVKEAEACFLAVEKMRKSVKTEMYVFPFARYELAMLWANAKLKPIKTISDMLKKALSFSAEYNFDVRLHTRIHMAMYELQLH